MGVEDPSKASEGPELQQPLLLAAWVNHEAAANVSDKWNGSRPQRTIRLFMLSTASTFSGTFALLWLFPPAAASLARIFIVDLVLPPACGCCAKVTAPSLDAETYNLMLMAAL